jgi:type IV pilus assembly protein PilY1
MTILNRFLSRFAGIALLATLAGSSAQAFLIAQEPLFLTESQPPLIMLNMTRDHRLYYEAYNDYSDLDGDGGLDIGYKPGQINYYGYFDSFKCYQYSSTDRRFNPVSVAATKQCGGAYWSGDFLNYLTTSRMDALRKVLYGGYRKTDTTTLTVLERVFIPQDAHSWGKAYHSIAHDGYDIADYAPLTAPVAGRQHLFANVTLAQNAQTTGDTADAFAGGHGAYTTLDPDVGDEASNPPLLRVLQNSPVEIWNWMSKERPVAGRYCTTDTGSCFGLATAGGWQVVPTIALTSLNAAYYAVAPATPAVGSSVVFDALIAASTLTDTIPATRIDCDSRESYTVFDDTTGLPVTHPVDCNKATTGQDTTDEDYATVITGNITVPTDGTYYFAVDGDDAVDLSINAANVIGRYGANAFSACNDPASADYGKFDTTCLANQGSIYLSAGTHSIRFRHQEVTGSDGYRLWWKLGNVTAIRSNYEVRVKVCDSSIGTETNCKSYTDGTTVTDKPTGLLHNYGANNGMYFGLLSGSYKHNIQGGVLRKNISSFQNEFSATTGIFTSSPTNGGIVDTINRLRITGFRYSDWSYQAGGTYGSCGWISTSQMNDGNCQMWGNPLGEMVWETLRYFNGRTSPTASFDYSGTTTDATILGLPKPAWWDPYGAAASRSPSVAFPYCSKPYILAISDSYPSFDSDSVPGSTFGGVTSDLSISGPNVDTLGGTMWEVEYGGSSRDVFIGQSGSTFDSAPTAKSVSSFGNIRGLAPSDPTRQGSYTAAELAYWARITDLRTDQGGRQNTGFYSVALAPPLPTIEIPVGSSKVTIVPFAKSVGGSTGISAASGSFQPTNQIVDFYVETIKNTVPAATGVIGNMDSSINGGRPYYRFRINYEDVEQGADHDMDAIVIYDIWLNSDNTTVSVNLKSEYAAGGIIQHIGYVISGTNADGTYLVVRDSDTAVGSDPDYSLDTPRVTGLTNNALPLTFSSGVTVGTACINSTTNYACRTFTPSSDGTSAVLLKDPLWYAAKWGGFSNDIIDDIAPNDPDEWDADNNGVPDNYFLVVNPLSLEKQLAAALAKIANDSGTAAALATNSTSLRSDQVLYQAKFSSDGWGGELKAFPIKPCEPNPSDPADTCVLPVGCDDPTLKVGDLCGSKWEAQKVMGGKADPALAINPATRVVLTYDPAAAAGVPFRWNDGSLAAGRAMPAGGTLQSSLDKAWNATGGTVDGLGADRVMFLRGDGDANSTFRTRPCITGLTGAGCTNYLGDIVNSSIQFVGAPAFGYSLPNYDAFVRAWDDSSTPDIIESRQKMVYVGANDGMLHGFDANTGEEKLAYIPSALYRGARLSKLTAANYGKTGNTHVFFVDGTPTVGDICTDDPINCDASDWKTILVGGLGGGGQGVYALNITDPTNFNENNAASLVMWEFNDTTINADSTTNADLGYTYSRPAIVRQCTSRAGGVCAISRWVVVFGNGYNNDETDGTSGSGRAALFVLDAHTGALLSKVYAGTSTPNGFANIAPTDVDGDGIADYVYAGDLFGNMVKFNLDSTPSLAYTLYTAMDAPVAPATPQVQPITSGPELYAHPLGGIIVLFGTGKYLEANDKNTSSQQTFYGIWDQGTAPSPAYTRSNLQVQQLISASVTGDDDATYSTSTRNTVDWATKKGWYLDLTTNGSNPSERVVYDPQILGTALNIVTIIPSLDVCKKGGDSWDFLLDPVAGGRLTYSAFTGVNSIVVSGVEYFASRRKSSVGISPTGTVITLGKGSGLDYKGGSSGNVEKFGVNLKAAAGARLSWREIRTD